MATVIDWPAVIDALAEGPLAESVRRLSSALGAPSLELALVDRQQRMATTLAGRRHDLDSAVMRAIDAGELVHSDGLRVVPLDHQGAALGALLLGTGDGAAWDDHELRRLGYLTAAAVRAAEPVNDVVEIRRTSRPMSLPASIQWSLLPPTDHRVGELVLSAGVEPAYETGGDVFDYSFDDGQVSLAVLDAMGHGLAASTLSAVATAALRRARREGAGLVELLAAIDAAVEAHAGGAAFVSAVVARIDTRSWTLEWATAGHPPPVIRADDVVESLEGAATLPLGITVGGRRATPQARSRTLAPGDAVVLYSDGVIDNTVLLDAMPLGFERFLEMIAEGLDGPAPRADRVLGRLVGLYGDVFRDDATLLFVRRS